MNSSFNRRSKATPQSILHSKLESWNTRKVTNTVSSSVFDDNIGEDDLSAQSTYDNNIDDSNYQNALCPNQKLLHEVTTSHPGVKKNLCISCAGNQQLDDANINEKYHDYKWSRRKVHPHQHC